VTIHGRKFWISAWIKEGAKGKYMSLAFGRADEDKAAETSPRQMPRPKGAGAVFDNKVSGRKERL
jgi:hypothetical protein